MALNAGLILNSLNESQKKAVTADDGPLLIVAGPGTGKTLTIVRRIAWLLHHGARPEDILAVTFTNRAAREMHEALGTGFTVYSREEQAGLLKTLLSCSAKKAGEAAERISRIKNSGEEGGEEGRALLPSYQAARKEKNAVEFDDLILTPIEILANKSFAFKCSFTHILIDEYQDVSPAQYALLRL